MNAVKTFSILCVSLLTVSLLSGCKPKGGGHGGPPPGFAVSVVGAKTVVESIEEKIALVGTLAANESVEIKSQINGIIEKISFDEGQKVEEGDVLLRIDDGQIKASLDDAQARLNLAETTLERLKGLVESRAVSQQEYDEAAANLETTRAQVAMMKDKLNYSVIAAPFDGITGERMVSPGQYISMGASLTSLISLNPIKVEFTIPERHLSWIKEKQEVEIHVTAYPEETFKGEVYFIDPQVDELMRSVLMKAKVSNRDGRLKPGMFANLNLIINTKDNALVIPETSVIVKGDETAVFVVAEDNKASMRPVKLGLRLPGRVEVLDGLSEGDVVVVEGFQKLGEGSLVNVRFEEAK